MFPQLCCKIQLKTKETVASSHWHKTMQIWLLIINSCFIGSGNGWITVGTAVETTGFIFTIVPTTVRRGRPRQQNQAKCSRKLKCLQAA